MHNIEFVKEKLNTLRVEFMAHILVIIALGSGLSKMYLGGITDYLHTKNGLVYTFGIILFVIVMINLILVIMNLNKTVLQLKKDK